MNLRELSQKLGLSQTTVSRALNGYPEVSPATRRRVEAAAQLYHYRPNARAKGLATGRSNAIAHVIARGAGHEMIDPVFADFLAGAGEVCAAHRVDMVLSMVAEDDAERVYREMAANRSVDGLIVHAPVAGDRRVALLRQLPLPFVVHGRVPGLAGGYSWVDLDNRRAFERATRLLLDLGHRDIALINGPEGMDFAIRRRDGYERALVERGVAMREELVSSDELTEVHGYEAARALLALERPPTALLTSSLISAIGARRACHERGLALGRDVSLVTHDDDLGFFRNRGAEPYFTSLRSPVRDHGRRAAQMLLRLIADPAIAPLTDMLEAELHVGHSTGTAPPRVGLARQG